MFIQYLENPFLRPNATHIKELHDINFLTQFRDIAIKRLSDALQGFYQDYKGEESLTYLKSKTTHVRLIGGFLTKFVNATSDADITVVLKDKTRSREFQNYLRSNINFKPMDAIHQYQINFFSDMSGDHIVKFKRYGIELLTDEIFKKNAEDVFLDEHMVVVEDFLSKKKLNEYFITPIKKCLNIINKEILTDLKVSESTCDKLTRIYPLLDRVGTHTFQEFSKFPKPLTIYEYTQDNLRYKALNEDSPFHKIMVLAQSKKIDELNKYLIENSAVFRSGFKLENIVEEDLFNKITVSY